MWLLQRVKPPSSDSPSDALDEDESHTWHLVQRDTELTIGRQESCDVRLQARSVSRIHAKLHVRPSQAGGLELLLTNVSKLGTMVNEDTLQLEQERILKEEDRIKFSKAFTLVCKIQRFVVCVSSADKAAKTQIQQACNRIGASVVPNWSASVTHLVCGKLKATAKLLLALTHDVPIVTKEFFQAIVDRDQICNKLPKEENFLPSQDQSIVKLRDPSRSRRGLFEHYSFLTTLNGDETLTAVEAAGGTVYLVNPAESNVTRHEWWGTLRRRCVNNTEHKLVVYVSKSEVQPNTQIAELRGTELFAAVKEAIDLSSTEVLCCRVSDIVTSILELKPLTASSMGSELGGADRIPYLVDTQENSVAIFLRPNAHLPSQTPASMSIAESVDPNPIPEEAHPVPQEIKNPILVAQSAPQTLPRQAAPQETKNPILVAPSAPQTLPSQAVAVPKPKSGHRGLLSWVTSSANSDDEGIDAGVNESAGVSEDHSHTDRFNKRQAHTAVPKPIAATYKNKVAFSITNSSDKEGYAVPEPVSQLAESVANSNAGYIERDNIRNSNQLNTWSKSHEEHTSTPTIAHAQKPSPEPLQANTTPKLDWVAKRAKLPSPSKVPLSQRCRNTPQSPNQKKIRLTNNSESDEEIIEGPRSPAITEERPDLLVRKPEARTRTRAPKSASGKAKDVGKHAQQSRGRVYFRKNAVAGVNSGDAAGVSVATRVIVRSSQLVETYAKESERELQLRLEQQREREAQEDHDDLFANVVHKKRGR